MTREVYLNNRKTDLGQGSRFVAPVAVFGLLSWKITLKVQLGASCLGFIYL